MLVHSFFPLQSRVCSRIFCSSDASLIPPLLTPMGLLVVRAFPPHSLKSGAPFGFRMFRVIVLQVKEAKDRAAEALSQQMDELARQNARALDELLAKHKEEVSYPGKTRNAVSSICHLSSKCEALKKVVLKRLLLKETDFWWVIACCSGIPETLNP
jgi:hypothetical protein